jgi:hypothetical protein
VATYYTKLGNFCPHRVLCPQSFNGSAPESHQERRQDFNRKTSGGDITIFELNIKPKITACAAIFGLLMDLPF